MNQNSKKRVKQQLQALPRGQILAGERYIYPGGKLYLQAGKQFSQVGKSRGMNISGVNQDFTYPQGYEQLWRQYKPQTEKYNLFNTLQTSRSKTISHVAKHKYNEIVKKYDLEVMTPNDVLKRYPSYEYQYMGKINYDKINMIISEELKDLSDKIEELDDEELFNLANYLMPYSVPSHPIHYTELLRNIKYGQTGNLINSIVYAMYRKALEDSGEPYEFVEIGSEQPNYNYNMRNPKVRKVRKSIKKSKKIRKSRY